MSRLNRLTIALLVILAGLGAAHEAAAQQANATQNTIVKLNLNTSTGEHFLALPGMSQRMVREFLEYRPYISIQQFRREIGKYVDEEQVAAYERYVFVPIDRNASDAATLQQIPGLDANEATQLMAARPFSSNDAFLARGAGYATEAELAIGRTYLTVE